MIEIYKYKNKYKNGHCSFACPFLFFIISIGYYETGRFIKSRAKFNQALI